MSVGPGVESVGIELYTAATVANRWDRALWDGDRWANPQWQEVGCEVLEAEYRTGAGQESGILSVPDAGALDLRTYDPDRLLDPLATASPYFGAVTPGTPVRLVGKAPGVMPAWSGFLDEGRYQLADATGRLRAVDGIAYLAQAEVAEGTVLPNTLRARVRAVVAAVGLGDTVPVQPEVATVELITDGSFEAGNLAAWSVVGAPPVAASEANGGAPNGARVLHMSGATSGPSIRQGFTGANPPVQGATYTLRGYAYWSPGSPTAAYIQIRQRNASGGLVGGVYGGSAPEIKIWAPLGPYDFVPDPAAASLEVWLGHGNSASDNGYWDAISVLGPDPTTALPDDPPVAPHDGKARSAWAIIQDAALDALTFVWLDPAGMLRFTPWGSLPDASYSLGCPPAGETGGVWVEGLATLESVAQAESIRNSVRSWVSANTFGAPLEELDSIRAFGRRRLDVARIVPNASVWAQRILDDRADSGLEVTLGEIRPYTVAELALLLDGLIDGPAIIRAADDAHGELVDTSSAVIGAAVGVTPNGWRFRFVTMIPRTEWEEVTPPPVQPPIPPPNPYHQETRSYIASSDALLALTSGGAKYGAGASSTLPVGAWQGWSYRGLLQFPAIPTAKLRRLVSATLNLDTTTQVRVGFGSSPTIELRRITGSWSAGSSSSPSGSNAVVWPGPSVGPESVRSNVTGSQNAAVGIRVDALVLPWLPSSVGGSLAAQRGIALYGGSGSSADTTEFWPTEAGGTKRPQLDLVLEVFD